MFQIGYDCEVEFFKRMANNRDDCFILDYYNITEFGPKAKDWLNSEEGKRAKVVGIGEHHKAKKEVAEARNWAQRNGWRSMWSPARATGRSEKGTSGGVAILSKKHLHLAGIQGEDHKEGNEGCKGLDWVAIFIKLKGTTVIYIAAYWTCGIGMTGENITKASQIMAFLMKHNLPFIILADWNMQPDELKSSGFLRKIGGEVLVPKGVMSTCSSGRMLDYGVVSLRLRPSIEDLDPVLSVPWSSHLGLRLRLRKTPRSTRVRELYVPKTINSICQKPNETFTKNVEECSINEAIEKGKGQGWQNRAAWKDNRGIEGLQSNSLSTTVLRGIAEEAQEVGERYAGWSRCLENYYMEKNDLEDDKCRGRGQHMGFKLKPAFEKQGGDEVTLGGAQAQLWSGITARLKDLRREKLKDKEFKNKAMKDFLRECAWKIEELHSDSSQSEDINETFALAAWKAKLGMASELDEGQLKAMIQDAERRTRRADGKRKAQIDAKVGKWVGEICSGNMKDAHKAISKEERYRPDIDETIEEGAAQDMVEVMEVKEEKWLNYWEEEDEKEHMMLYNDLEDLRHDALQEEPRPKTDPKRVKECTHLLNNNRSLGIDQWAPQDWQDLPQPAYEEMADIIDDVEESLAMPIQILLNIVALLPKPQGGERPVGLVSLFGVLWSVLRGDEFKTWDNRRAAHWDDAVKGSSALKAAIRRRMLDESWVENDGYASGSYWDIEKFDDSIKPRKLIRSARDQGLNLRHLCLSMQIHLAPRVLRLDKCCSKVLEVASSILAGLLDSNGFARSVLYDILERAHNRIDRATTTKQFVDDVAQNTRGMKCEVVAKKTVDAAEVIQELLTQEGFKISNKSTLICSSRALEKEIQKRIRVRKSGLKLKSRDMVKDLGIDATSARKRSTVTQKARIAKAKKRGAKAKWLRSKHKGARKLYKTNLWPVTSYGVAAYGVAPTVRDKIRTIAAEAALGAVGQCATTAIHLNMGAEADPAVSTRMQTVKEWVWLWDTANRDERRRIRKAWMKLKGKVKGRYGWRRVRGPIAAIIRTLTDLGWNPKAPDVWIDLENFTWIYGEGGKEEGVEEELIKELQKDIEDMVWSKAEEHRGGKGTREGVDWTIIKRNIASLDDKDMRGTSNLLMKTACGAMWPMQRKHEAGLVATAMCPRCGIEEEN